MKLDLEWCLAIGSFLVDLNSKNVKITVKHITTNNKIANMAIIAYIIWDPCQH